MKGYNPGQNGWNTLPICRSLEILLAHSFPPPHLCNVGSLMAGTFRTLYEGGREEGGGVARGKEEKGVGRCCLVKEWFSSLKKHDGRGMAICKSAPHNCGQDCSCNFVR